MIDRITFSLLVMLFLVLLVALYVGVEICQKLHNIWAEVNLLRRKQFPPVRDPLSDEEDEDDDC